MLTFDLVLAILLTRSVHSCPSQTLSIQWMLEAVRLLIWQRTRPVSRNTWPRRIHAAGRCLSWMTHDDSGI